MSPRRDLRGYLLDGRGESKLACPTVAGAHAVLHALPMCVYAAPETEEDGRELVSAGHCT
jgi:hypothetical protein